MSIELILKRRSIRKYSGDSVNDEQLENILQAAMAAPSAKNRQPWHFVVVRKEETLKQLSEAHPYGKMLAGAAAAMAVCGDMNVAPDYWSCSRPCRCLPPNILQKTQTLTILLVLVCFLLVCFLERVSRRKLESWVWGLKVNLSLLRRRSMTTGMTAAALKFNPKPTLILPLLLSY